MAEVGKGAAHSFTFLIRDRLFWRLLGSAKRLAYTLALQRRSGRHDYGFGLLKHTYGHSNRKTEHDGGCNEKGAHTPTQKGPRTIPWGILHWFYDVVRGEDAWRLVLSQKPKKRAALYNKTDANVNSARPFIFVLGWHEAATAS